MRDSGRLTGAVEVLTDFAARHVPLKSCLSEWGRNHRFAGSKDRAWISDLCHDVIRSKSSLGFLIGDDAPRGLCISALRHLWGWDITQIEQVAAEEPFGPGALSENELSSLSSPADLQEAPQHIAANIPEWIAERGFGDNFDLLEQGTAMSLRAPVDMRVNALKSDVPKAAKMLSKLNVQETDLVTNALRIAPPKINERKPALDAMPAFAKGMVEVQDLGSQLVSLAAGDVRGYQVLDYCAGGGGKTLALSGMSQNTGQIFSWDINGRRLAPIFDRLKRAGTRNVQVRSPADGGNLNDLIGQMDVVFVDAPCTGSGTWRRKPDTKWKLTEDQLQQRMAQQDEVLMQAAKYVKEGGRMVYVTCSILPEENTDRVTTFLAQDSAFEMMDAIEQMQQSGLLAAGAEEKLNNCRLPEGGLQLTPAKTGTDGFFVATMKRVAASS